MASEEKNIGPLGPCPPAGADLECYKLRVDFCKFRADEYRSRYESMRGLEWNTIFQGYTGYAAIAIAFTYIEEHGNLSHKEIVAYLAMAATIIFYAGTRYLAYRIQERLIVFNKTFESSLSELGAALAVNKPEPGTGALGHQYYWTYDVQHVLSTGTMWGLLAFEATKGRPEWVQGIEYSAVVLALVALAIGLMAPNRKMKGA